MKQKLNSIFAKILGIELHDIHHLAEIENSEYLESLKLMTIIASIEEEFEVNFAYDEITSMINYKTIFNILEKKLHA